MTPTSSSWAWTSPRALASVVVLLALAAQGRTEDEDTTQRFSVTPESVEVKEGDDVFLRCIVVNQQGNAQWTKDGFALGFERHVPGYPRYRYAGDPSKGEHHLVIKGVTLQDDGEYQCQVGPTITIKPIWVAANVTVMVSPTSISVVGKEDGASVEVKAGTAITLECLVTDARPAASVMWYRDGLMLDQDLHEEQLEASTKPRRWSVRSKLLLRPTPADNGQQYSCRALHPALKDSPTSLVASVTLSVLHPPSAPAITGYAAGDVLLEGQRLNLTCRVLGGNPRPWVLWYRHGRPLDHASINQIHRADATVSTKAPISNVREAGGVSSSQQVTGSRQEDGAEYECRVTSPLLQAPLSTSVSLTVHYGPKGVDVTGPSVVAAGQEFVVICRSSPSNPPATITWMVQGERTTAGPPVITEDEGGGWVTTSRLTHYLTRMRKMSEATVECRAHNPDAESEVSRKHVITIIKRPGTPVVEVVEAEGAVVAGNTLGVVCTTDGGNPPPNITMYKGNEKLPIKVIHEGTMTKAGTEFKVTAADNEAEVKCEVTSLATKKPMSAFTTIHLLFPAWEVSGWVSPSTVDEDQEVTLTCETSSSLPPSNITWRSRGTTLEGATTKHTPGVFGGTVTRSELVLKPKAEDNEKVFVCEADNDLGVIVTANVSLNVLHEPVWVATPAHAVEVEEGDDLLLVALAAANPGPVSYSWWRGPSIIEDMGVKGGADGRLILSNIDRQQSGNYSVTAHTSNTDITAYFSVVVQYGPEEIVAAERVVVDEDKSTAILCQADGNPTPNVTWTRDNNNNNNNNIYINSSGAVLASGIGEARLLVEHASKADTGLYLCQASNSVASAAPVYTALVVTQAPTPTGPSLETGEAGKSWAAVGASGRFDCRVRTAPEPQFRWTVNERELQNSRKYSIHIPQLVDGVVEWSSVLEVRSVTIRDYGVYTCTAENEKGAHAANFTLSPPVLPAAPLDVNVTVVSGNSALISWSHNRMGAVATGFTVKYQASGTPDYMTQDIEGGNRSSMVVEGLTPGQEFSFSVQAFNEQGRSPFSQPPTAVTMIDVLEEVARGSTHGSQPRMPRLMLLLISLTGTALLVLNISIIVCFLRRRALNRSMSASSSKSTAFEVYTPATTPGPPAPDEHLPLTSANDGPPPDYHQVECQTRVDECPGGALASLAPEVEPPP
ncbi:nephrin-like, partial [Penaeus monodon]|uniref:nephrin-like n=1 Tax=Penaeus monodon TaxID=6687 RepID=UPI0018A7C952